MPIPVPPAMRKTWVQSLGWEDSPGGVHGNPLQYSCLENPHGQRSLAGYSPWGHKESDATEHAHTLKYGAGCPTLQVREVREAVTLDENSLVPRFWKVPPP